MVPSSRTEPPAVLCGQVVVICWRISHHCLAYFRNRDAIKCITNKSCQPHLFANSPTCRTYSSITSSSLVGSVENSSLSGQACVYVRASECERWLRLACIHFRWCNRLSFTRVLRVY